MTLRAGYVFIRVNRRQLRALEVLLRLLPKRSPGTLLTDAVHHDYSRLIKLLRRIRAYERTKLQLPRDVALELAAIRQRICLRPDLLLRARWAAPGAVEALDECHLAVTKRPGRPRLDIVGLRRATRLLRRNLQTEGTGDERELRRLRSRLIREEWLERQLAAGYTLLTAPPYPGGV